MRLCSECVWTPGGLTEMTGHFIDQTLGDGQESLWGMRVSQAMMMPALPHLDEAG